MILYTTLRLLKQYDACIDGYIELRKALPKKWGLDRKISLFKILESNEFDDVLWALRAVVPDQKTDRDRLARLFAADCAEHVLINFKRWSPSDIRPQYAVQMARKFALCEISKEELMVVQAAAESAARAAAESAAWSTVKSARLSAESAESAAWSAAENAHLSERRWQYDKFMEYLREGDQNE